MSTAAVLTFNLNIIFGANTRRRQWAQHEIVPRINLQIEKNKNLKEFTTFKIGGPAQFFCSAQKESDIEEAVIFAQTANLPIFILGGGSNILISDHGFHGLIIKIELKGIEFHVKHVTAQAGENWDGLVEQCVERDLYGLENLSLIPGTVGAAPVQNIGAYGSEVKDTVDTVRVYDTVERSFKNFSNMDCQFHYRDSLFKREIGRYIIVSVTFLLQQQGKVNIAYKDVTDYFLAKNIREPSLKEVRRAVIEIRTRKLPDVTKIGTAGSFFKNPILTHAHANELEKKYPGLPIYPQNDTYVKVSLGWILDKVCGFKGVGKGNVGIYKNQALVLVNNGSATEKEIRDFAHEIEKAVLAKTNITIEPEVQFVE